MPDTAPTQVTRVLLAEPRGFCAGVEMAIKALSWMIRIFPAPVYCYHEIVHNQVVVDRFRQHGVIFVDSIDEVPEGAPVMLSAHGSAPEVVRAARSNGGAVIDAVCPLVTKVHHEVKTRANQGFTVIYVGHAGHDEAVGTMAVAPAAVRLVETPDDVAKLDIGQDQPVALLAQTTLSHDEWSDVKDRANELFPNLWQPGKSDLCFATTNRQAALKAMVDRASAIVVIGSENSSNTRALEKVAVACGCPRVVRVNSADELPNDLAGVVGLTAGASAPDELVEAVIDRLNPADGIEVVRVTEEDEYFPPPPELRKLVAALEATVSLALGVGAPRASVLASDRTALASTVLAEFAVDTPGS